MTSLAGASLYTILVFLVSSTAILSEKNSTEERIKRNDHNDFHPHSHQSRRLHDGKAYSSSYNKLQPFNVASHNRPRHPSHSKPIHVPPYAVKMEPLVQYSQRDPLYHDKEITFNISLSNDLEKHSKADTYAEATNNFIDYPPRYGVPPPSYNIGPSYHHLHQFYKEPEPIIEIIIKESNETLPTPATPTFPPTTTAKEPIQVFYVKYKKNRTHTGKEEVVYEEPIPALTPLSTDLVENHPSTESYQTVTSYPNPPPPSTTLRTIIRPDSEVYHGTGLKVTFGNHEEGDPGPYSRSSEAQKRDSIDHNEAPSETKSIVAETTTKLMAENRQSHIDFTRFINTKDPILTNPPHTLHQRQNQPQITSQRHILQPLQIEDGSFEQPPPPSYTLQNSQNNKIVFPSSHQNIPFRPQHSLHFQPNNPNEFQDLSLLQRQPHNQFQFLHPHSAAQNTQNKVFPKVTQAILQQSPFPQNQQYSNADSLFSQPLQTDHRFTGRQNLINFNNELQQQNTNNRPQPVPIDKNNLNNVNNIYNPQQVQPFIRNEFLHQAFSNQNSQQISQHQSPVSAIDRQKQFQYEKIKQPLRRPIENDQYSNADLRQLQTTEKPSLDSKPVQQPNYLNVIPASHHRQQVKSQKSVIRGESSTLTPIQDGQIFKAISQSEEHEIIQGDQFEFKVNQQQQKQQQQQQQQNQHHHQQQQQHQHQPQPQQLHSHQQLLKQYVNVAPHPEAHQFKPPKQTFEVNQRPIYQSTTMKLTTKQEELNRTDILNNLKSQKKKESVSKEKEKEKEKEKTKSPPQLAALPDEVPDDLREQLLSSGILSNADIQILDYDKVGDIPIENLPPEALENLYGSGSAPVPSISFANASKPSVEMKVVRYDPSTSAGQSIPNSYLQEDSTEVDPVVLNDSSYNRYLPLKVKGSQFPIPDSPLLKNKKITSVVVLAPVDYDYVQQEAERQGKSVPQVHGVRFVSGDSLKALVKNPSHENFVRWITKERQTPANKQSVILLVTNSTDEIQPESSNKEIFMYDIPTGEISKLEGELSAAFVNVAESNAESEDLENLSEQNDGKTQTKPARETVSEQSKTITKRTHVS